MLFSYQRLVPGPDCNLSWLKKAQDWFQPSDTKAYNFYSPLDWSKPTKMTASHSNPLKAQANNLKSLSHRSVYQTLTKTFMEIPA